MAAASSNDTFPGIVVKDSFSDIHKFSMCTKLRVVIAKYFIAWLKRCNKFANCFNFSCKLVSENFVFRSEQPTKKSDDKIFSTSKSAVGAIYCCCMNFYKHFVAFWN